MDRRARNGKGRSATVALALFLALASAFGSWASTIRIKADARVGDAVVTLSDVAEITTADDAARKKLASVELAPAPAEGESLWLEIDQIKDHLARKGARVGDLTFTGSRRVEVKRADAKPDRSVKASGYRAKIIEMVRRHLTTRRLIEPDDELSVNGEPALAHLEQTQPSDWSVELPEDFGPGSREATLEIHGAQPKRFTLAIQLRQAARVVIARQPIRQGETITADQVQVIPSPHGANSALISAASDAIGMEAQKDIAVGQAIAQRDVKPAVMVARGSQVTVWAKYKSATVQVVCTALEDGGPGEWIAVQNPTTRQKLKTKVRVAAPHVAVWSADAPPSDAAGAASLAKRGPTP